jgi:hypothetical protein
METNEKRNGKPSEKLNGFLKKSAGIQSEKPSEKLNVFFLRIDSSFKKSTHVFHSVFHSVFQSGSPGGFPSRFGC